MTTESKTVDSILTNTDSELDPYADEFTNVGKGIAQRLDLPVPEQVATQPVVATPTKVRREIDFQDGSGVQVFEADNAEALADKLLEAQRNATMKIRELAAANRAYEQTLQQAPATPQYEQAPTTMSAEEQFALAQQLQTAPLETLRKFAPHIYGVTPEQFQAVYGFMQEQAQEAFEADTTDSFLSRHDAWGDTGKKDYYRCPENKAAMERYLQANNLQYNDMNLEYAFQQLSLRGLLKQPPEGEVQQSVSSAPVSSGLSDRAGNAAPTAAGRGGLTLEEARRMSAAELKARIVAEQNR